MADEPLSQPLIEALATLQGEHSRNQDLRAAHALVESSVFIRFGLLVDGIARRFARRAKR